MLTISSYENFKTREVDDRIWLIFSPLVIIITLIEFFLKYIDITIIVSIMIYY
jgi:hypothetical protein